MIPGIDPRVDIAFKRVFGAPACSDLTISLINAVLRPAPWRRLTELEFLNPYTEQMTIDDKLSILDIKARDDQGRLFNVEMQMATTVALRKRFLYYWSRLYSSQLIRGNAYEQLHPTISICFVNGRLFPAQPVYHRRFRLSDAPSRLLLTEDLDIHVLELVNFDRDVKHLNEPLDRWLYFLNNGEKLDTDALPTFLNTPELRQAMEVLKMYSQDEMARELYEGRLKRARDEKMHQQAAEQARAQLAEAEKVLALARQEEKDARKLKTEAEQQAREMQQQAQEGLQQAQEAQQQEREAQRQGEEIRQREREIERREEQIERRLLESEELRAEAERESRRHLVEKIQLCQRLLRQSVTESSELFGLSLLALQKQANQLQQDVLRSE